MAARARLKGAPANQDCDLAGRVGEKAIDDLARVGSVVLRGGHAKVWLVYV